MDANQPEETELPQVVNLSKVSVENVEAELVRSNQTSIQQLNAEEVELHISALGTARTGDLRANDSIVGVVVSEQATVQDSIVGGVRAQSLSLNGVTVLALANSMSIENLDAIAVAGAKISAENLRTGILISPKVNGYVITMTDGRTILLAGLAGGIIAGLILLAGKLLFGRNK